MPGKSPGINHRIIYDEKNEIAAVRRLWMRHNTLCLYATIVGSCLDWVRAGVNGLVIYLKNKHLSF
jgi:hypothetical protein